MLEGKRFLAETGSPIWNSARSSTVLALCEPEPLTVATWTAKSFTTARGSGGARRVASSCAVVISTRISFRDGSGPRLR